MKPAKISDETMMSGRGSKLKTSSDQLAKLTIENFTSPMSSDASAPSTPPTAASSTDSSRNDDRMLRREKPSARSVPTSWLRLATWPYMVMAAPIMAPMEK